MADKGRESERKRKYCAETLDKENKRLKFESEPENKNHERDRSKAKDNHGEGAQSKKEQRREAWLRAKELLLKEQPKSSELEIEDQQRCVQFPAFICH